MTRKFIGIIMAMTGLVIFIPSAIFAGISLWHILQGDNQYAFHSLGLMLSGPIALLGFLLAYAGKKIGNKNDPQKEDPDKVY